MVINMSYCRFENTLAALRDCYDSMDEDVSESEATARQKLIELCAEIAAEYGEAEG